MVSLLYQEIFQAALPSVAAALTHLSAALENCRVQFGPTLFTALHAYHGDMTTVWEKIIGYGHNQALIEAGVLLVDHE